jgi:hypothetical protein
MATVFKQRTSRASEKQAPALVTTHSPHCHHCTRPTLRDRALSCAWQAFVFYVLTASSNVLGLIARDGPGALTDRSKLTDALLLQRLTPILVVWPYLGLGLTLMLVAVFLCRQAYTRITHYQQCAHEEAELSQMEQAIRDMVRAEIAPIEASMPCEVRRQVLNVLHESEASGYDKLRR